MDILTAKTDITYSLRKNFPTQVYAIAWQLLANEDYKLKLFRGEQMFSVCLSKSMLRDYEQTNGIEKINMKISETLKNQGGENGEKV